MNLKESFAYRQFLAENLKAICMTSSIVQAFCEVKETHFISKTNPDEVDQVYSSKDGTMQLTTFAEKWAKRSPEAIMQVAHDLRVEMNNLDQKILLAKISAPKNVDLLVAVNKAAREEMGLLLPVSRMKTQEAWGDGTGYRFNNDGVQVPYRYKVKTVATIDFDRKAVKKKVDQLQTEIDERAYKIDELMLTIDVDYDPVFNKSDSLQDIMDMYEGIDVD